MIGLTKGCVLASKLIPLYEQVARRIEQQIRSGRFDIGQKIYSIREICEEFAVADVTAKKAISLLAKRGMVRTVVGSGVFVSDYQDASEQQKPAVQPLVAFLKVGLHAAPIFFYEIDLIHQELSKLGYPMLTSMAPAEEDIPQALEQIIQAGARCLLFFPPHKTDFRQASYMTAIRRTNLPLLLLESRSQKDSYVVADLERATRELADYLYESGHRRICMATAFPRKVAGFKAAMARWNDPTITHWILDQQGKSYQALHDMAQQVANLKPRPTAVIAADDDAATVMIGHFMSLGIRVPQDISVVTFDDHPQLARRSPVPLTVVRHPCLEIAQEVALWASERMNNEVEPRRRLIRDLTGTLVVRDSCAPPGKTEPVRLGS